MTKTIDGITNIENTLQVQDGIQLDDGSVGAPSLTFTDCIVSEITTLE